MGNQMIDSVIVLRELIADESLWLDSTAVGKRLDASSIDPETAASQARIAGRIFAAWDGRHFHYPAFQFEKDGGPRTQTSALVEALPRDKNGTVGLEAGSTPKSRTVVKGLRTSNPALQLFAASLGCGTALCIQTHRLWRHRVLRTSCGRRARA